MSSATFYGLGLLGLGLLGVGEVLHIVGLATPQWSVTSGNILTVGLWERCVSDTCAEIQRKSTEIQVCEAFAIIGMLLGLLAGGLGLFFLVLKATTKRIGPLALGVAAAGNCALGFVLVCVIIWGAAVEPTLYGVGFSFHIGYSFGLSLAGGIVLSIGGDIIYLMSRRRS